MSTCISKSSNLANLKSHSWYSLQNGLSFAPSAPQLRAFPTSCCSGPKSWSPSSLTPQPVCQQLKDIWKSIATPAAYPWGETLYSHAWIIFITSQEGFPTVYCHHSSQNIPSLNLVESGHSSLKTRKWSPISPRVKAKILTMAHEALYYLPILFSTPSLTSAPLNYPLHSSSLTLPQTSFPGPQTCQNAAALGLLPLPFPCLSNLPQTPACLLEVFAQMLISLHCLAWLSILNGILFSSCLSCFTLTCLSLSCFPCSTH